MLKKLRKRFILINMIIVTAMLLIIFGLIFHFTRTDLDNKSNQMLQSLSQNIRDPGNADPDVQLPYFTLQINSWGEVVASGNTHYDISDTQFVEELIQQVYATGKTTGTIEKYDLKYTVTRSLTAQRITFVDVSSNKAALTSLLQTSFFTGLIALAAFAFISILLARWAVKPIDQAWQQQQQFVSDASHELKTPLTVIISNAELLQNTDYDEEEHQHFTQNILSSSRQMRCLAEGLLDLARADNGQIRTNFEEISLSKIVSDSILPFEPVFFENGMILENTVEPDILLQGSSQHLRQLTDILLDNARKYSSHGVVELQLRRTGKNQCLLTVSNPGTPIPRDELKKIFQRFYRSDTARTNTGSFGLGLSIAQRIVQEHGGEIWAESNETGNCFNVLLPCSATS